MDKNKNQKEEEKDNSDIFFTDGFDIVHQDGSIYSHDYMPPKWEHEDKEEDDDGDE